MKSELRKVLPILFESQYLILYSYPLFMGLAWGFAYFFTQNFFEYYELSLHGLRSLFIGEFLLSWIGAKLFFLWFSSGPKIYQYIYADYFWLGGGFVFYGGLLFGLAFYYLWAVVLKKFDYKKSHYLLPGLVFGHAIGRMGCLLAGCCYGAITQSIFAIKIQDEYRYPVQAIEALSLLIIGVAILKFIQRRVEGKRIIAFYLIAYSVVRFLIEYLRGDEVRGIFWMGLSASQLVSVLVLFLGTSILIKK